MSEFYNEAIKNAYLDSIENEGSKTVAKYVFIASKSAEENLEMDLYNFSINSIEKVMENMPTKSVVTAQANLSHIRNYINWSIVHGYRENNLNPLDGIDGKWYEQFVDQNIKQFISKTELHEIVSKLTNYQDKIIPVLLFNGVYGTQSSEIRNIRYEDIKNIQDNKLRLYDDEKGERYITLENDVVDLLLKAYYEQEYYNKNGTISGRAEKSPLADSEFVVKSLKRGRAIAGQRVSQITIINRVSMIAEQFDLPDLTPKSISRSGMLYEASKLIGDKEELTQDDFQVIGEKFNLSKIKNQEYEYYNVTYLKGFINRNNIEKLYGNK